MNTIIFIILKLPLLVHLILRSTFSFFHRHSKRKWSLPATKYPLRPKNMNCPAGWGCRIHRLILCRGVRTPYECPGYDIKQSDGEVPVMLELWRMQSTLSLSSLPGPLRSGLVAPNGVLSMSQIELNCVLNWITWNRTVLIFNLRTFAKLNCLK